MNNLKEKLIEIKNLLRGHVIALIIILVVIIGIPVTLYLVKQQQDLRSKATGGNSLTFSPSSRTVERGTSFDVDFGIRFDPQQQLTGMDVTITYSANLEMENFTKETGVLSREVDYDPQPTRRTVHYIAVNRTGTLNRRNDLKLGTLRFKAINDGPATITATHDQIVVLGQASYLDVDNASVTYTIGGSTPSPSPSPSPSAPPVIACVNGDVTAGSFHNGCVDANDYNVWLREFRGEVTTKTADFYTECNANNQKGDGVINISDYNIWLREFNAGRNRC